MKKLLLFANLLVFSMTFAQEKDKEQNSTLDEVTVGSRSASRTKTSTPLPVDILSAKDLSSTGQTTFDKALQYRVPSFNTVNTPVNDATSLLDPYEIRNMGPSRTLILINGKRKNLSSLVYVQTSPGRGETGADISAIPTDAIERVEILRDGASAQYGSDAIAGVMNIILKKGNGATATMRTGATGKGDGETFGLSINNGLKTSANSFLNYTVDFSKSELANRPGKVDADGEVDPNGGLTGASDLPFVKAFLAKRPDAGNINGSPETAAAKFLINGGRDINENTKLYYNAAYVYKKVNSFANYRTPYWRPLSDYPYLASIFGNGTAASYEGYVPTFQGELNDYNATIGYAYNKDNWDLDASLTTGGNQQDYTVGNTHNRSQNKDVSSTLSNPNDLYYASNPSVYTGQMTFTPGGVGFNHYVGNIDVRNKVSETFRVSFGSEIRTETFEVRAGDVASYTGRGADSYPGNKPENSGKFNRYNLGFYAGFSYDITKEFLVDATVRYEDYSDFGSKNVWKVSSAYRLLDDKITLRGSLSTGFRAPTLHQLYTQKEQASFSGGTIKTEKIINNFSTEARLNNVAPLKAESSTNFTIGTGMKFGKLSGTVDYYYISLKDRIVLSDKVKGYDLKTVSFFTNAINTVTSGLDFVISYKGIELGDGKLNVNYSSNFTIKNSIDGNVKENATVTGSVFGKTQEALLLTSRPKSKHILGLDYSMAKFDFSLNNTLFGKSSFKNADLVNNDKLSVEFSPKMVTDLGVSYKASEKISIALNINNLLNVLPEWKLVSDNSESVDSILAAAGVTRKIQENYLTFNGRYQQMTYDGSHFSQLGTMWNLSLNYKF